MNDAQRLFFVVAWREETRKEMYMYENSGQSKTTRNAMTATSDELLLPFINGQMLQKTFPR